MKKGYHLKKYRGRYANFVCLTCGLKKQIEYCDRNKKYCDVKCRGIAFRGKDNNAYNPEKIKEKKCQYCHSIFKTNNHQEKKFCNEQCYHLYYSGDRNVSKREEVKEKLSISNALAIQEGRHKTNRGTDGYFFSMKNNKNMYYRSFYELLRFQQLEDDIEVDKYKYEEKKIKYTDSNGNMRTFVIDLTVYYKDGSIGLEEIKAQWNIDYYNDTRLKLKAANEFARSNNMKFSVITEKELNIK